MAIAVHALDTLEFWRVRAALGERTATRMGQELAAALAPQHDPAWITTQHEQLEDALFGVALNLGGIEDLRPVLADLVGNSNLQAPEIGQRLLQVAHTLDSAMSLKRSVANASRGPLLAIANQIGSHVVLVRTIYDRIGQGGAVRDEASPRLRTLRRRLNPLREEIRARLNAVMERHGEALQDKLVTLRRERYVIPVKASFENQVPGIVVDSSNSNQTVFVEPTAVIPLNNELTKLFIEEEQEVNRILLELIHLVQEEEGLLDSINAIAMLDLVAAKAALVRDWNLNRPTINPAGEYELTALRHPLITNCVANDLKLGASERLLLITGPNMGGKTVTIKSLGLAIAMNQAGLYVAANQAKLPLVEAILVDIGDDQSIEASLSTFAAHLQHLGEILAGAGPNSLVLIDELGSGTDPNEGAALSQGILEALLALGARGVVTSHLAPLKVFAMERTDVQNASMGFDLEAIAPTYKLHIGHPGRSYALAIAKRLGFLPSVVARAREIYGPEGQDVERLLDNLERERSNLAEAAAAARQAQAQAERDARQARERLEALEAQRETLLAAASDKANGLYRDAFEQVRQLKTRAREVEAERPQIMNQLRELRAQVVAERPQIHAVVREPDLKLGAVVEVPAYNAAGTVLELRGDDVIVQLGLLKVALKRRDLKLKRSSGNINTPRGGGVSGSSNFDHELNLRGSTVEEALDEVRNLITEAFALRESPLRLLHGKGEGTLRRAVREYLRSDKRVESFHDAQPYDGGHGVTIVHLKVKNN
jgi:DNA mismatch repair protein MutS2